MLTLAEKDRYELEAKVKESFIVDELAIRYGQEQFKLYFEFITGEKWNTYQDEWLAELEREQAEDEQNRTEIKAPRKHGKSTFVLVWVAWQIGRSCHQIGWRKPIATIICGSNENEGLKKSLFVRAILESKKHQQIFPDCIPNDRNWGTTNFSVEGADPLFPTCMGVGILSLRAGPGAELIVGDDICDLINSYYSPASRKKVKDQFNTVADPMLLPHGKIVYIYTPYHHDDLSAEIQKNPKYVHIDNSIAQDLKPLWPERYGREWLIEKRRAIGSIAFARAFHCTPASDEDMPLRFEWLQTYRDLPRRGDGSPAHWNHFLGIDPAVTKKTSSDYWAFVVIAKSPSFPGYYVRKCVREHMTKDEALKKAAELHAEYHFLSVRNEATAAQDWLTADLQEILPDVHIEPMKPTRDKMSRLMEHQALFENGHVHFHAIELEGKTTFLSGQEILIQETFGFPLEANDDTMDGLVMGIDSAKESGDTGPAQLISDDELKGMKPEVMNLFKDNGGGF